MPWLFCCRPVWAVLVGLVVGFGFVSCFSPLCSRDADTYGCLPVSLEFCFDFVESFGDCGQDVVACVARVVGFDADDFSKVGDFLGDCCKPVVDESFFGILVRWLCVSLFHLVGFCAFLLEGVVGFVH